ncbi:MAG: hypothetical protein WCJ01_06615 [Ignavibacteria bacterium]
MKIKKIIIAAFRFILFPAVCFFSFMISSCGHVVGSKLYSADYPLTRDTVYSVSGALTLRIPSGWTTAEDNDCKCIDIWLIRDDFSAMIDLFTLNIGAIFLPEQDSMLTAVNFSRELKIEKLKEKFKPVREDEFFELDNNRYAAYEYQGDEGLPIRVIVFKYGERFFELAAIPSGKVAGKTADTLELFRVQQSLLKSIR